MGKTHGLSFKKFDLHVHTPASHCYTEKTITPTDIVQEALSRGLSGIAITDHNTGESIDLVKEATNGTDLGKL